MVAIKGAVGSRGSSLAPFIPLVLWWSCGCKVTMNDWVRVLGLALDESRWFAIYRLLNIFCMASRRDTLSLPTSACGARRFPTLARVPEWFASSFGFYNVVMSLHLTGNIPAVPEWSPSAECLLMFCLLFALSTQGVWGQGFHGDLLQSFGAPITLSSSSHWEVLVLCRKMSSVGLDGKGVTEMAVVLAP